MLSMNPDLVDMHLPKESKGMAALLAFCCIKVDNPPLQNAASDSACRVCQRGGHG